MFEAIIIIAIYTAIVLFFVPLERIGRVQTKFKDWVEKMLNKAKK